MPPTRRNLFQSHLSRRPASGAPSSTSTSTSTSSSNSSINPNIMPLPPSAAGPHANNPLSDVLPSLSSQHISSSAASSTTTTHIDNGEIIARDKNGKFQLDIPVLPPIPLDEEEDEDEEDEEDIDDGDGGAMEGIEGDGHGHGRGRPSAGSGASGTSNNAAMSSELVERDKEKLEAGLVEMMYRNRNRHLSCEPEILNLIQQSLRSKVAALDDDNWMFEMEDDPHV